MFTVRIDEKRCIACKMCELACSFHHNKTFDPSISSIEILRHGKEMEITGITYNGSNVTNHHLACDFCNGEEMPQCAKYCEWNAVLIE